MTKTELKMLIQTAKENVNNESSKLCFEDSLKCFENNRFDSAKSRALKSLAYSVSVFSPIYKSFV